MFGTVPREILAAAVRGKALLVGGYVPEIGLHRGYICFVFAVRLHRGRSVRLHRSRGVGLRIS